MNLIAANLSHSTLIGLFVTHASGLRYNASPEMNSSGLIEKH